MNFDDLARIVDRWERLDNGCRRWTGTVNSNGCPVVTINGRSRSVKAVLTELLHATGNRPTRVVCHTEGCVHPRHYVRALVSTAS